MKPLGAAMALFFLAAPGDAGAAAAATQRVPPLELGRRAWHDQKDIATSPLRLELSDGWVWGPTALAVIILAPGRRDDISLDEKAVANVTANEAREDRWTSFKALGDGRTLFGLAGASYLGSYWLEAPRAQRLSANWIEALIDASLWVAVLKLATGRKRPEEETEFRRSRFTGPRGYFEHRRTYNSFPSGHTTLSFATAAVLTRESGNSPWVAVPSYGMAGWIGFTRVYTSKHWVTDVVVGAALGHSIGALVENRRGPKGAHAAGRWEPTLDGDRAGVRYVYRF